MVQEISVPATMKAWRAASAIPADAPVDAATLLKHCQLQKDVPIPKLCDGEMLVKIVRATIHPWDVLHMQGAYNGSNSVPFPDRPIGFEGAGIVVQSKAGWFLMPHVGDKVLFYASGAGAFGEYVVVKGTETLVAPKGSSFEKAACAFADPTTAVDMVEKARSEGHKVFVNTGAAGAIGRMMIRYAQSRGMEVICVVRREEQEEICRNEGAKYTVNSSRDDFEDRLAQVMKETKCSLCYDCIGGTMTNSLLKASPDGGTVTIYDTLSTNPTNEIFLIADSFLQNKKVDMYDLNERIKNMWTISLLWFFNVVTKEMGKMFAIKVAKTYPLEEVPQAFEYSHKNMTAGKVQIVVCKELDDL